MLLRSSRHPTFVPAAEQERVNRDFRKKPTAIIFDLGLDKRHRPGNGKTNWFAGWAGATKISAHGSCQLRGGLPS
jgi:hypothetical protein